jgi:hypothetical protein
VTGFSSTLIGTMTRKRVLGTSQVGMWALGMLPDVFFSLLQPRTQLRRH